MDQILEKFIFYFIYAMVVFGCSVAFHKPIDFWFVKKFEKNLDRHPITMTITIATGIFIGLVIGIILVNGLFALLGEYIIVYYWAVSAVYGWFLLRVRKPAQVRLSFWRLYSITAALIPATIWLLWPGWITYNLIGIMVGFVVLSTITPIKINYLMAVLIAILVYDFWGVLGTFQNSQGAIVQAISQGILPLGVILHPGGGLLGLGDVVLPGIIVITSRKYGLTTASIVGYGLGLLSVIFLSYWLKTPLPATVTLIPTTLFAMFLGAWRKGFVLNWK